MQDSAEAWSLEEFGDAALGDPRRTARLVAMGSRAARQPGGKVTQVFEGAAREGAYRWLENEDVSAEAVTSAAARAAARRAANHRLVFVPIDQSSLSITDRAGTHFGPKAQPSMAASGAQAMSALAVSPDGVPLGLVGQSIWTRSWPTEPKNVAAHYARTSDECETQRWNEVISASTAIMKEIAPDTLPWFQLDRGADASLVLRHLVELGVAFTVRAASNRRIRVAKGWRLLNDVLGESPCIGHYPLVLDETRRRARRVALIDVRAVSVDVAVPLGRHGQGPRQHLMLTAIEARERSPVDGETPVLWRLLTNRTIETMADVRDVIDGYTMRWRVEEFHLAWKSGTCNVEDSLLRSVEAFTKWATILAAVAVRAERLKQLSRETPELPAETEFSRDEIDAVIILRKPKGVSPGATATVGQIVRWIADIGGYTGKSSGGPPGVRVISRALDRVYAAAEAIASLRAGPQRDL